MKKLTAILALGVILYSCTESEKPDQMNLEDQVSTLNATGNIEKNVIQTPSQAPKANTSNAMIMASFTPIDDVSGDYTTETTLIDISAIPCFDLVDDITDGTLTLDFDKTMDKRQAAVCGWGSTPWGSPPIVEGPNPHILFSDFQNSIAISLSESVKTFGFEMTPNRIGSAFDFEVFFYNEGYLIGSITKSVAVLETAKLFAATTDASFDYVLITANTPSGFAVGQFRYILADEKNPFTVDVKPDSCENPVNVNSNGVIPVGILASLDLDVNDIDLSTVRLNGVAPKMSSISDLGGFYEKEEACDCDPTEFDGVMDLDLKFDTQEIVATLGEVSDGEKVTVSLSFNTVDGKSWTGEDCIWIIKKPVRRR